MKLLTIILVFLGLGIFAGAIFLFFFIAKKKLIHQITKSLNSRLIMVTLPKNVEKEQKPDKEVIGVMEQFYTSIANINFHTKGMLSDSLGGLFSTKPYIVMEIAVPHIGEEISFYVSARGRVIGDVEKQIYSYFPKAQIAEVEDYNIFNPSGVSVGAFARLEKSGLLPVRTYKELETDPLREITNALSKLQEVGEGAAFQVVIKPSSKKTRRKGFTVTKLIRQGKSLSRAIKESEKNIVLGVMEGLFKRNKEHEEKADSGRAPVIVGEDILKAIENKASKPQFDVNIRLLASAKEYKEAEDILRQVQNAFSQLSNPALNSLHFVEPSAKFIKRLFFNFAYRLYDEKEKIVLSAEELTGMYHFPNNKLETPKLKETKSKIAEPPSILPKEGLLIGKNTYRGEERQVFLSKADRRRHMYIIGQTGTGKTVGMKNMIIQDIRNGEGVGLIDPHGDVAEELLGLIPEERYKDVVVIDPSDLAMPIGLNMLEYDPKFPEQKTFIVNELIAILDKLYDLKTTGGPMFEQYTRNALLLLMEYPEKGFTLLEIPKVLADKEFRRSLLVNCTNILVRDFWEKEAEKAGGEAALANMVPYITSKFNVFLANDYVRPIISQSKSTINFREIMDSKKILIVNLTKGRLGDINASLLGLIIVGKILMASFSRVDMPEDDRQDFYLYIDEFQNFATDSIATILSEARKYRLDLIIAHQFIEQLKKEIKDAVFGNVGNIMAFRIGATDAEFLVKQFEPVFDQNDLVNIDNFNAYVKLLIGGKTTKPFSISTYPPEKSNSALGANVRRLSALKYGRERAVVEREIMARIRPEYNQPTPPATNI